MEREEREKATEISIEEFLEKERHKLGTNLTPINNESFNKWKADRKKKVSDEEALAEKKKADAYSKKGGSKAGLNFSGRELFHFNPDWSNAVEDDDGAMDMYEREESDNEEMKEN
jgi:hypothetical protein